MSLNNTTRLTPKVVQKTLFLEGFNYQPISSTYSNLKNNYDDDGTQIDPDLIDNEGVEDAFVPNYENNDDDSLSSYIEPPQNNILEIEGVDRMGNETEEREIEGMYSETEGAYSYKKGVDN